MNKVVSGIISVVMFFGISLSAFASPSPEEYSAKAKLAQMNITVNPVSIQVPADTLSDMVNEMHECNPAASRSIVSYYDALLMQRKSTYNLTGEELFDLMFEGNTPAGKQSYQEILSDFKQPTITVSVVSTNPTVFAYAFHESKEQNKREAAARHATQKEFGSARKSTFTKSSTTVMQYTGDRSVSSAFYLNCNFEDGTTSNGLFYTKNTGHSKGMKKIAGKTPLTKYDSTQLTGVGTYEESVTVYPSLKVTWAFRGYYGSWNDTNSVVVFSD